jgi:uncharacterized protein YndB with AHSA1/START domain
MTAENINAGSAHELVLTRLMNAPREKVYQCWTQEEHLVKWFAPKPWTTPFAKLDVRPGGTQQFTLRSPEGVDYPNSGVYLEVIPNRKLVWTDAYASAWVPSAKPFFTAILTFEDEGGKTRYTATARHWKIEDMEAHVKMGFHEGWGACADQLEALATTL